MNITEHKYLLTIAQKEDNADVQNLRSECCFNV